MLEAIECDLFDIVARLREISASYHVFYNHRQSRYEVHNCVHPVRLSLAFIVPFDRLDERTLEYARKTRIENFDDLQMEMDAHNREVERCAERKLLQSAATLSDMMEYAAGQVHSVFFGKSRKWF